MKLFFLTACALVLLSVNGFADNYALSFTPTQWAVTQTPAQPLTILTNNFTFECWIKWDGTNAGSDKYIFYNGNPSFRGQGLYVQAATQQIIILYGGNIAFPTGVTVSANVPVHIALYRFAGTSQLYVNGVATGGATPTGPNAAIPGSDGFSLGTFGGTNSFPGQIDNFRVWSVALTAANVQAYMGQASVIGHPNFANLVANYPFDEGTGQTAASVGGSNPQTLVLGSTTSVEASDPTWAFSSFPAPTLTEWGMILMAASLVGVALYKLPLASLAKA